MYHQIIQKLKLELNMLKDELAKITDRKIAYLDAENSGNLDFDTSNGTGEENKIKAILEHPNVVYYPLTDFVLAFNNEEISDLGYIAIKEE